MWEDNYISSCYFFDIMKPIIFAKLSIMMLLEYFIWGSWYVTMGTYMSVYLNASGVQIGAAYSALAIATMISPFFVGMVADRFFAAQRIMAECPDALIVRGNSQQFQVWRQFECAQRREGILAKLRIFSTHRFD